MVYKTLMSREPIHMRAIVQSMQDVPVRRKGIRWMKKDWRYIIGKKQFRIYSMRVGQTTKYKLASNENSYLWQEIGAPGRSSWEMADNGQYLMFRMLIDGSVRSNIYRQRKEEKQ
jgi:hypothetical protein